MPITVSRTELGRELVRSAQSLRLQIKSVEEAAQREDIDVHAMRDSQGNFVLAPLLVAQAQVLHAIALINQKE